MNFNWIFFMNFIFRFLLFFFSFLWFIRLFLLIDFWFSLLLPPFFSSVLLHILSLQSEILKSVTFPAENFQEVLGTWRKRLMMSRNSRRSWELSPPRILKWEKATRRSGLVNWHTQPVWKSADMRGLRKRLHSSKSCVLENCGVPSPASLQECQETLCCALLTPWETHGLRETYAHSVTNPASKEPVTRHDLEKVITATFDVEKPESIFEVLNLVEALRGNKELLINYSSSSYSSYSFSLPQVIPEPTNGSGPT